MARQDKLVIALTALWAGLAASAQADPEITHFGEDGAPPSVRWATALGTADAAMDEIDAISVDPEGNTVISGIFRETFNLGDQTLRSAGEGDIFIASLSPEGAIRWIQQVGSTGEDNTFDLTTDGEGNIYLSGGFSGTVRFGDVTLESRGDADMFIAKLAPDGTTVWARSFGSPARDGGNEISVLASGEIAVAAITLGDFTVDGETFDFGGGNRDSFLIRMTPDGEVLWTTPFDGSGTEQMRAVAMNEAGEVFVGFQFSGELRSGPFRFESRGDFDGAVFKLDAEGVPVWAHQVGGAGLDNVRGVAAGPDGSVYAAGRIEGAVEMMTLDLPALGDNGDDFMMRLSSSGAPEWLVTAAGAGRGRGWEIVSDPRGVVVSGLLEAQVTVRRNRQTLAMLEAPGRPTSLFAGFSPDGELRFVFRPTPVGRRSGAFGADMSVSRDARFAAQVIPFRGRLRIAGDQFETPAPFDPALVLLDLNGS